MRDQGAPARVQVAVPPVAVVADRDELLPVAEAQADDAGVAARAARPCRAAPCGRTAGRSTASRRSSGGTGACGSAGRGARKVEVREAGAPCGVHARGLVQVGRPPRLPLVDRRVVGQGAGRDVRDDRRRAGVTTIRPVSVTVADVRGVQVPFREDLLDLPLAALLDDDEHPLLRLGEHDLVGVHRRSRAAAPGRARSRSRHPPRLAVSQVEQVSPAAPMSWMPTTRPGTAIISRQASIRSFSMKGSPFCTAGRSDELSALSSFEANAAPPRPSRPVGGARHSRPGCPGPWPCRGGSGRAAASPGRAR